MEEHTILLLELAGSQVERSGTCTNPRYILRIFLLVASLHDYFSGHLVIKSEKNLGFEKIFAYVVLVCDETDPTFLTLPCRFLKAVTQVKPYICTMPLRIQLNLVDLTKRDYGTSYKGTLPILVHAKCGLRRIYFSDCLYFEEELRPEFYLCLPLQKAT